MKAGEVNGGLNRVTVQLCLCELDATFLPDQSRAVIKLRTVGV